MRVWYQLIDNRSEHEFTIQSPLPQYLTTHQHEFCILPLFASLSEAKETVKFCNKSAGGDYFSYKRVIVSEIPQTSPTHPEKNTCYH